MKKAAFSSEKKAAFSSEEKKKPVEIHDFLLSEKKLKAVYSIPRGFQNPSGIPRTGSLVAAKNSRRKHGLLNALENLCDFNGAHLGHCTDASKTCHFPQKSPETPRQASEPSPSSSTRPRIWRRTANSANRWPNSVADISNLPRRLCVGREGTLPEAMGLKWSRINARVVANLAYFDAFKNVQWIQALAETSSACGFSYRKVFSWRGAN